MATQWIICMHCRQPFEKERGAVNRANRAGLNLYCGRRCSGLGRRKNKTVGQKKAEKAAYDRQRRAELGDVLLAKKRAAYRAELAADPEKVRTRQREYRRERKAAHNEYCRRPEYRKWKRQYDRQYRANRDYGPFADAFLMLQDLESELDSRASKYERSLMNGTLNKTQRRKREYEQQPS